MVIGKIEIEKISQKYFDLMIKKTKIGIIQSKISNNFEKNLNFSIKNIKKALNKIADINKEILNNKLFPMTFGGEHSITPGCIVPFVKKT